MRSIVSVFPLVLLVSCGPAGGPDGSSTNVDQTEPGQDPRPSDETTDEGGDIVDDDAANTEPTSPPTPTETPTPAIVDPLAPLPPDAVTLHDVSYNLEEILEFGALSDACDRWRTGTATDRRTMLLCGKYMFFYEAYDTPGVPRSLAKFVVNNFPDEVGTGWKHHGMIPDPSSPDGMPVGIAPAPPTPEGIETYTFTCASCHFSQLPDGRYAVGAPNHKYDYGRMNLSLMLVPSAAFSFDRSTFDPDALAAVQPMLDRIDGDWGLRMKLVGVLAGLIALPRPEFPPDAQRAYAIWKTGTLDPFIAPQLIDDGVHTVSRIAPIWDIPRREEEIASGMPDAMLGSAGNSGSVASFLDGFVAFFAGPSASQWDREALAPLEEYVYSLRAPENPAAPPAARVEEGLRLFNEKGCLECHAGPRGSGKRLYDFEEIGTDAALERWLDPNLTGEACCDAPLPREDRLTYQVKSPRLSGLWTSTRFLHNGAVDSLEDLFCLNGERPFGDEPFGGQGHDFTCDDLSDDEKRRIIDYLRAR